MTSARPSNPSPEFTSINRRAAMMLEGFALVVNVILFLIPGLVLIGWIFGIEILKRCAPGLVEMNPISAVNFILLGIALADVRRAKETRRISPLRLLACLFVALFGIGMGWNYAVGLDTKSDTHLDQILFRSSIGTNRMAPNTAANFFLISLALLLVDVRMRSGRRPAEIPAVFTGLVALLALVGYSYRVGKLYGVGAYIPMALHVALCFLLLSLALLCARHETGLMARVSSSGAGGAMVRRLLFWLIAVPLAAGWLILAGHRAGALDAAFGFTLFVVVVIVFVSVMVWTSATSLDREAAERGRAEDSLRRARDELEVRVQERTADLAGAIAEVRTAIVALTSLSQNIVESSTTLASSATETAAAVTQTTVSIEQLRQTAAHSRQNASTVADSTREAAQITERGKASTLAAEQAMARIRGEMETLAQRTANLAEQTKSIEAILATVDDIAEQTNVLAINAAIEAVKAGEHGQGFSVVAAEVRSLAAQSQNATRQVREIVREINKANAATVSATRDGRAAVEAGVAEFSRAGEAIASLTERVSSNAQAAVQISASIEQQSAGIAQVAEAMTSVKTVSGHNANTARELEAAAQNLNALGEQLRTLMKRYRT